MFQKNQSSFLSLFSSLSLLFLSSRPFPSISPSPEHQTLALCSLPRIRRRERERERAKVKERKREREAEGEKWREGKREDESAPWVSDNRAWLGSKRLFRVLYLLLSSGAHHDDDGREEISYVSLRVSEREREKGAWRKGLSRKLDCSWTPASCYANRTYILVFQLIYCAAKKMEENLALILAGNIELYRSVDRIM